MNIIWIRAALEIELFPSAGDHKHISQHACVSRVVQIIKQITRKTHALINQITARQQHYLLYRKQSIPCLKMVEERQILISLNLPYSLQKYGCQVFRDSKLFCTINQVIIPLPPSSEKIYANIFTITYYKYPLSEGKNQPIHKLQLKVRCDQSVFHYRQLNNKSMLGIYQGIFHQADIQVFIIALEQEVIRLLKIPKVSSKKFCLHVTTLQEIRPWIVLVNVSHKPKLAIFSDQSLSDPNIVQLNGQYSRQFLISLEGEKIYECQIDLYASHRIQFKDSFKPQVKFFPLETEFTKLKVMRRFPTFYVDPSTLQILGEQKEKDQQWKITYPSYDGNLEIWSRFNHRKNSLEIQKRGLLCLQLVISFLVCEYLPNVDDDLLMQIVKLTTAESRR